MSGFEMDIDEESEDETQHDLERLCAVLEAEQHSVSSYSIVTPAESCPSFASGPISDQIMTDDLSKIEMAIALNRFTDEKLQRLEILLLSRLKECKEKLKSLHTSETVEPQEKPNQFRYVCCGKPYFKDKNFYPAPLNDDTKLMMKSEMYDFTSIPSVPGWTVKDKSDFISLILKMSQNIRAKELNSKIAHIRRQANSKKIEKDFGDKEIQKLRKQLEAINKQTLKELALPLNEEYDWETLANKLSHRHSAHEYRALWKLFLHPSINKNGWSKTEHILLQKLASSHSMQDWDQIAKELNTGRTGYQCFVYFRTNMRNGTEGQKWTKEEEEYLKRLVEFYREENYIPWGRVAASMENRTKVQIYNKFTRMEEHRKGRFIPEEDAVILTAVEHFGTKNNFRKIQQFLPGRSVVQLRNRYHVLSKNRVSTVWSIAEDKKLVQLLANQDETLSNYAKLCEYFPGKDRAQLRVRHKVLLKWMKQYPNLDISFAPRRGSRRLGHGKAEKDLNNALENLKNKIANEVKEKKSKTVSVNSSEQEIEDAIVATLVTEAFKSDNSRIHQTIDDDNEEEEDGKCEDPYPTSESENKANIEKLLILLRCNLNKYRFMASDDYRKHFGLNGVKKSSATVKVKCYSRKKDTNAIKIVSSGSEPDLWGNNKLGSLEYVLPPHLATITGCKTIMSFVKDYADQSLSVYFRNNKKKFREEFDVLMERFNLLFLWPVLLSNESPARYIEQMRSPLVVPPDKESPQNSVNRHTQLTVPEGYLSAVTIPPPDTYFLKTSTTATTNDIDLPLNDDINEVTLKTNFNTFNKNS